jgi:uncharacterized RDD family membrane protein YckC
MPDFAAMNRRALGGQRRSLVTPEGVDLQLSLADAGQRIGAFLLDLMIMTGILIVLTFVCIAAAASLGSAAGGEIALVIWLLGAFLPRNFYFVLMEMGPSAATFGKRAAKIRVVARNGERLTADRVIARNMMREIEFYLPLSFLSYDASEGLAGGLTALAGFAWTAIFLFFPLFNKDRLRVGDLLAGTWVVNVPRRRLSVDQLNLAGEREGFAFTDAQLDVYGVYELQTLEQVLRDDHMETIGTVAETIRRKIGVPGDYGADRDFLVAYYDSARTRMERGLLFGKRREDKFDRGA